MWNIAVKTLLADRGKIITALIGVAFSILMMNIQGGFFFGLMRKASLLVDHSEADIWVGHEYMNNVDFPHDIPESWIQRVRSIHGIQAAEPYLLGHSVMTMPNGGFETVLVVGCERNTLLGNAWNMHTGNPESILRPDGIIVDVTEMDKLQHPKVGDIREIGGLRAKITGLCQDIQGFLVTPYVFTTIDRARAYLGKRPGMCSYFLVKVTPGTSVESVRQQIKQAHPDSEVLTKNEYSRITSWYWIQRTGIGISFGAATVLGLIVGLMIISQTLYASVLDRIMEFGTFRAIGVTQSKIYTILLTQACILACVGGLIGLGLAYLAQDLFSTPIAPIAIPGWLAMGSFAAVTLICAASSLLPYLRIRSIDPALVLQT